MKIRIKGNSIRLRLMQSEVSQMGEQLVVSDSINFGMQKLHYTLKASEQAESIQARLENNEITVAIPLQQAKEWVQSDEISIESFIPLSADESLRILVEKDFKCLTKRTHEDESDAYPHPKEGEIVC